MTRFFHDQRGAAGVFSVLTLMALVLCIGYTAGLADATLLKMRVQDAADAAAYSGARVRGNLYAMMGLFNVAKIVLFRRATGRTLAEGEVAVLRDVARITGEGFHTALVDDNVILIGETVADKAAEYAARIDSYQQYIMDQEHFIQIIESEVRTIAARHEVEFRLDPPVPDASYGGGVPEFDPETDVSRYDYHWHHVAAWREWTYWRPECGITQPVFYEEDLLESIEDDPAPPFIPGYPFTPYVISVRNDMSHQRNAIKVVVQKPGHESSILPNFLQSHVSDVIATACAGCYSPSMESGPGVMNLYTTDFRAELLSLTGSLFHEWLQSVYPSEAARIPWVPELVVH